VVFFAILLVQVIQSVKNSVVALELPGGSYPTAQHAAGDGGD
jgi:hypothetical protein